MSELFRITPAKHRSFHTCLKQYWFKYLSGQTWPERDENEPPLVVGKGVHRAMHVLTQSQNEDVARQQLDIYLRMPKHSCAAPGTEAYDEAMALYEKGVEAHRSLEAEESWAERETLAPWPSRGIEVSARVDRVDRRSADHYVVIDWKTGGYEDEDQTDLQLDIGHVAARRTLRLGRQVRVTAIGWNLRKDEQRVRELVRDDAEATMELMAANAARMQRTTEFPATPSSACRFCEWQPQCPESNLSWDDDSA
jgi:ATP-dependent exoDNAse (exonuclease V) beta subunit